MQRDKRITARFRAGRIPGFATGRTVETAHGESAARVKIKTLLLTFPVFGKFLFDPGQIKRTYIGACSGFSNLDVSQLRVEDMVPDEFKVLPDQKSGILGSLFPCQLPRMRLFVKSNQRKNDSERLKKAGVGDRKAGFCFYTSTKRQRHLRFLMFSHAHLLTHNAKLGWWR